MKTFIAVVVSFGLYCASANASQSVNDENTEQSQEAKNELVIRTLYAAFAEGDGVIIEDVLADGVEWIEADNTPYIDRSPYVGKTAVLEDLFPRIGADWNSYNVTPLEYVSDGNVVVAIGRYDGNHKLTGKDLDTSFVHVWEVTDSKVSRFRQFSDSAHFKYVTSGAE